MADECNLWPLRTSIDFALAGAAVGGGLAAAAAASHAEWIFTSWLATPLMYGAAAALAGGAAAAVNGASDAGVFCDSIKQKGGEAWECASQGCAQLPIILGVTLGAGPTGLAAAAFDVAWSAWAPGWAVAVVVALEINVADVIGSIYGSFRTLDAIEACSKKPGAGQRPIVKGPISLAPTSPTINGSVAFPLGGRYLEACEAARCTRHQPARPTHCTCLMPS
jgi:hypothetical protein